MKNDENKIKEGRNFLKYDCSKEDDFVSDQEKKLPQPPLFKEKSNDKVIILNKDFKKLIKKENILDIICERETHRIYRRNNVNG